MNPIVFFHPPYRVFSFSYRNTTNNTVNTECPKPRITALADTRLSIYFWFKLIDGGSALQIVRCSDKTVQYIISNSIEGHKPNPMSINFFTIYSTSDR
jgi:hypothetical protein